MTGLVQLVQVRAIGFMSPLWRIEPAVVERHHRHRRPVAHVWSVRR